MAKQETKPVPKKVLAESIVEISKAFAELRRSGLNQKAIIVLIHDATGLPKRDITRVLDSLDMLSSSYCDKK